MEQVIRFDFKRDDSYRLIPVNGVWGGVTPRGDVWADFFYECYAVPEEVTHAVLPEGRLGEELSRQGSHDLQRTLLVGMMLTAEQAESIGRWLQAKAREIRTAKEEQGGMGGEPDAVTTH